MKVYEEGENSRLFVLQQRQCAIASLTLKNVIFSLFWYSFTLFTLKRQRFQCAIYLKCLSSIACSSNSFLNFRLSSTMLLIKWLHIKEKRVFVK